MNYKRVLNNDFCLAKVALRFSPNIPCIVVFSH